MTVLDEGQATPLSTQPAPPTRPSGRGPIPVIRGFWRRLTSMRTALLLLALLALAAIPGTLIPQRSLDPVQVDSYLAAHPHLGRFMDKLSLFNVFASPWFAAIYLLLFVSLIGCLIPRIRLHAKALRRRPPNAPRNLMRMTASTQWTTEESVEEFATRTRSLLRRTRWRADLRREDDGVVTVASEKGYLRETGNLIFHVSLVALLVGIALGGLYGYKGTKLLTKGAGFANARESYDVFQPSKLFSDSQLAPFSFTLDHFDAKYTSTGEPTDFDAYINYKSSPDAAAKTYDLRVNHPLDVAGAKVFLVGHGYAIDLRITDPTGNVVTSADVPFLPDNAQFVSHGVVKMPSVCTPVSSRCPVDQLGLTGFFYPTAAVTATGDFSSSNPALNNPLLVLQAWKGDLGLSTGVPQSVYSLDVASLKPYQNAQLTSGDSWRLKNGMTVKVLGIHQWATFQIAHEPGKTTVLVAAILIIAGLLGSLRVRRRRFWIRAVPVTAADGTASTVVTAAGLARTDVGGFVHELDDLAGKLGRPTGESVIEPPATERD
jgi:cytochrome c biogenesis protein